MTVAVEDGDVVGSVGAMSGFRGTSSLEGATVEEAVEVRLFIPGGLGACRAFSYNPHALQMILPFISRRHRGVEVVPQFEHSCPDIEVERDSVIVPAMVIGKRKAKRTRCISILYFYVKGKCYISAE
jgi:hypothetical protein